MRCLRARPWAGTSGDPALVGGNTLRLVALVLATPDAPDFESHKVRDGVCPVGTAYRCLLTRRCWSQPVATAVVAQAISLPYCRRERFYLLLCEELACCGDGLPRLGSSRSWLFRQLERRSRRYFDFSASLGPRLAVHRCVGRRTRRGRHLRPDSIGHALQAGSGPLPAVIEPLEPIGPLLRCLLAARDCARDQHGGSDGGGDGRGFWPDTVAPSLRQQLLDGDGIASLLGLHTTEYDGCIALCRVRGLPGDSLCVYAFVCCCGGAGAVAWQCTCRHRWLRAGGQEATSPSSACRACREAVGRAAPCVRGTGGAL